MTRHKTYEHRVEVRRIVERFPTGEIKRTEFVGLEWVDENEKAPDGLVYCAVGSDHPEALEWNIRVKRL